MYNNLNTSLGYGLSCSFELTSYYGGVQLGKAISIENKIYFGIGFSFDFTNGIKIGAGLGFGFEFSISIDITQLLN